MTSFHGAYRSLLTRLYHANVETNARTRTKIKVLPGSQFFQLDLSNGRLPVAGNRAYWPHIAAAETAWQVLGTQDPTFIMSFAPKLWEKFIEDGQLKTAYGWRWRNAFGRDQIDLALLALRTDPSNRQVWVQAWDPRSDGLGEPNQPKNIPCPLGFSLNIIGGRLHMSVFIRSSDVFVGLPYDVMGYALTMDILAACLQVKLGMLSFTLAHAHIYEPHFEALEVCLFGNERIERGEHYRVSQRLKVDKDKIGTLGAWATDVEPNLPCWDWSMVANNPEGYVQQVMLQAKRVNRNQWHPCPEVVE